MAQFNTYNEAEAYVKQEWPELETGYELTEIQAKRQLVYSIMSDYELRTWYKCKLLRELGIDSIEALDSLGILPKCRSSVISLLGLTEAS